MRPLLALPLVVAVGGAAPLPGLPSYTAGYASWTKLNAKPLPRRAVDAHSSIKNVYVSKLPRAGRYPVGTVVVKEGRQRAGAPVERAVAAPVQTTVVEEEVVEEYPAGRPPTP